MDREIKMKLLEALMGDMDEAVSSKLKKNKDPIVKVKEIEEKEMPMSEAKDMIKEKMLGSEEPEMEESEVEPCVECEDEEDFGSDLMKRLKELKAKRK